MYDESRIGQQQILDIIKNLGFTSTLKLAMEDVERAEFLKCVVDIQGMKCQSCVRKITDTLTEKEGVTMYDEDKIEPQRIAEIIQDLGFVSTLKF